MCRNSDSINYQQIQHVSKGLVIFKYHDFVVFSITINENSSKLKQAKEIKYSNVLNLWVFIIIVYIYRHWLIVKYLLARFKQKGNILLF